MDLSQLHFSHPLCLWGAIVIPLIWAGLFFFYRAEAPLREIEKHIDSHLLPHLLINPTGRKDSVWKWFLLWSIVWTGCTLAMAGPRWDFRELETFSRDQKLVILLDLSKSMNATDVKPSRLIRAKQKIEDLINASKGMKIGLVAFAADPHMISPITDDQETIRHLLPSIDTDLVYVQGSRLSSALTMASNMFAAEPGQNKTILVISDGGFEDASAITTAKNLAANGIHIYSMGIGTLAGAPLQDPQGNVLKKSGAPMLSKLEKDKLIELSKAGNGRYLESDYSDRAETILLAEIEARSEVQKEAGKTNRFWEEGFYFFLIPTLPFVLLWFRRSALFSASLLFLAATFELKADIAQEYFKNSEELGLEAVENGDYDKAVQKFQDPYRKGVACYKAGNYAEAENLFRQSSRPEVASQAAYNLANALVYQQKLKEAIAAYEEVLEKWPEHTKAKENLEIVKKLLEEQNQDQQDSNSDQSNAQDKKSQKNSAKSDDKGSNSEQNESDSGGNNSNKEPKVGNSDDENSKGEERPENDKGGAPRQEKGPQSEESRNESSQPAEQQTGDTAQKEKSGGEGKEPEEPQESEEPSASEQPQEGNPPKAARSQEDQDADLWLDQISNDPKSFLKNKFYLESKRNGTTEGIDPW